MALDETVVASVANANFKTIGDQPALDANHARALANLALANAVSHQHAMNQLQLAVTSKAVELVLSLDPTEALGNAVVGQQGSKVAGSTPPVSVTGDLPNAG